MENASDDFPSKRSSKISFQTSPEVRCQFRRKLRQLHSGNRWCLKMLRTRPPLTEVSPRKNLENVSLGLRPQNSEKSPKSLRNSLGESPESVGRVFSDCSRDFLETFRGSGAGGPRRHFPNLFSALRARRARETSVRGGLVRNKLCMTTPHRALAAQNGILGPENHQIRNVQIRNLAVLELLWVWTSVGKSNPDSFGCQSPRPPLFRDIPLNYP